MSIAVSLQELPDVIAARGASAYLVTVGEAGPRVVSVAVVATDGALHMRVGRRTAANLVDRPSVTLLWPTDAANPKHSLLVDGEAQVRGAIPGRATDDGAQIAIAPSGAILHAARAGAP